MCGDALGRLKLIRDSRYTANAGEWKPSTMIGDGESDSNQSAGKYTCLVVPKRPPSVYVIFLNELKLELLWGCQMTAPHYILKRIQTISMPEMPNGSCMEIFRNESNYCSVRNANWHLHCYYIPWWIQTNTLLGCTMAPVVTYHRWIGMAKCHHPRGHIPKRIKTNWNRS